MAIKITSLEQLKYFYEKLKSVFVSKTDIATQEDLGIVRVGSSLTVDGAGNVNIDESAMPAIIGWEFASLSPGHGQSLSVLNGDTFKFSERSTVVTDDIAESSKAFQTATSVTLATGFNNKVARLDGVIVFQTNNQPYAKGDPLKTPASGGISIDTGLKIPWGNAWLGKAFGYIIYSTDSKIGMICLPDINVVDGHIELDLWIPENLPVGSLVYLQIINILLFCNN